MPNSYPDMHFRIWTRTADKHFCNFILELPNHLLTEELQYPRLNHECRVGYHIPNDIFLFSSLLHKFLSIQSSPFKNNLIFFPSGRCWPERGWVNPQWPDSSPHGRQGGPGLYSAVSHTAGSQSGHQVNLKNNPPPPLYGRRKQSGG